MMKMNPVMISPMMRSGCLVNTIWPKQRAWLSPSFDSSGKVTFRRVRDHLALRDHPRFSRNALAWMAI